jgi:hypothetical protein
MKKSLTLILLLLMLAALPRAHGAEARPCLDRSMMIDTLIAEYGEQLAEVREIKGKGLLEFHVSPKEGTWTALLTNGNGVSCVLAVGEGIDPDKTETLSIDHPL